MTQVDPLVGHRGLSRYLLDGEKVIAAVHQHWAKVAEPVGTSIMAFAVVLWGDTAIAGRAGVLTDVLWWAWGVVVARMLWKLLEWRHDWFVATDKRLLLTYGLITQKVAMMPLAKVTDMSYNRSPTGRLLGYGTFVMESAGQDQALHRVTWVPDPDHTYRAICAEIFGVDDRDRMSFDEGGPYDDDGGPSVGGRRGGGPSGDPYGDDTPPRGIPPVLDHSPHSHDGDSNDYSTPIRIRRGRPEDEDYYGDSLYQSPDQRESSLRDADTGPIPLWRPGSDA